MSEALGDATRTEHPYRIWESIVKNGDILEESLGDGVTHQVEKVAEKMLEMSSNRVFLLGTAASNFAGIAEKYAFEEILSIPASVYLSSEFKNYPPADLGANSVVFFHSHSGNSKADAEIAENVRALGGYTVGVIDNTEGILVKSVDDVIIGPGGLKKELPATRTYTSAIFRMMRLVIALGKKKGVEHIADFEKELLKVPQAVRELTREYDAKVSGDLEKIEDCSSFFVIGSGPNFATVSEAAIGFSQSAGVPSQAFRLDTFLHGPIQALRKEMCVVLVASPGASQKKFFLAAKACKKIGAKVVLLASEGVDTPEDIDVTIKIPSGINELLTPLYFIVPLWILGYRFACEGKGGHPDRLSMDLPEFKEAFGILKKG